MQEGKYKLIKRLLIDRYTEIERENRILLEKMTNIMSTNNKSTFYLPNSMAAPSTTIYVPAIQKKSLNKEVRKRELLKITMEN